MNKLATLQSKQGTCTILGYDFSSSLEDLVQRGDVDCYIMSTEDGFSPLGRLRGFLAQELRVSEHDIGNLADWNRFENTEISLIGFPSQNTHSQLRGLVLAASETSECYQQFASAFYGKPYRDFYYNVAYESIAYAVNRLGAKKIAISHLSGSGHFHEDIATCIAEALAHFCDNANNSVIDSFMFVGCCVEQRHLLGIQQLNAEGHITKHRQIHTQHSIKNGFDVVSLDW